jgi:hypothetical protein
MWGRRLWRGMCDTDFPRITRISHGLHG